MKAGIGFKCETGSHQSSPAWQNEKLSCAASHDRAVTFPGQKMAAEAAAGSGTCPQRDLCELLATKMNVWEQIRLFFGDLSLALYERGRQVGLIQTEREENKHKTRKMVEKKGQLLFS